MPFVLIVCMMGAISSLINVRTINKPSHIWTLAYFLLSRKPMREKELVGRMLILYVISGAAAVVIAVLTM